MKRTLLSKFMLLLCIFIVGGGNFLWAQETLWSEDFSTYNANDVPSGGTYSYACTNGTYTEKDVEKTVVTRIQSDALAGGASPELLIARTAGGSFQATIPLDNIAGTLTLTYYQNAQKLNVYSTTEGVSGGQNLKPADAGQQTTTFTGITKEMTSITIIFASSTANNVRLDNIVLTGHKATSIAAPSLSVTKSMFPTSQSVTITTNEDGGTTYYTTDGTTPTKDSTPYTEALTFTETTTLKAVTYKNSEYSIVVNGTYTKVIDGVFDFITAGDAGYNYGSGMTVNDSYTTTDKTWTAGNVTMVTSRVSGSGYRWYTTDKTLRFYNESQATFSVPSGYLITQIVTTGGNFNAANVGTLSSSTWTGTSQTVTLSATSSCTIGTITVTYIPAYAITPGYEKTTYVTPSIMDFSGDDGLDAYVATSTSGSWVRMTKVTEAVPASTPLLLVGTAGTTYNIPVVESANPVGTNLLKAGDGTTEFNGTTYDYLLYSDGKFYQIGSGTVATNKAYLHLNAAPSAHALEIVFDDDDVTAIKTIDNKTSIADNSCYDLMGRKVAQPTRGLYIVNGKKVIMK